MISTKFETVDFKNHQLTLKFDPRIKVPILFVRDDCIDVCVSFYNSYGKELGISVSSYQGYKSKDLSFLKYIRNVRVAFFNDPIYDVESISQCTMLEDLTCAGFKNTFDISMLKNLRNLSTHFENVRNIENLTELRALYLFGYKDNDLCLKDISELRKLKELDLINPNIQTLDGIELLSSLSRIGIHYGKKLTDISGVSKSLTLTEIQFENCKKITSYAPLSLMVWLTRLSITKSAPMKDLSFIIPMENLNGLFFGGTNVESGDLHPILHMKNMMNIYFDNKRHYSHSCNEIISMMMG